MSEPTKVDAQLNMLRRSSVYDELRISLTATRITRVRKTGVVVELVPHAGDGIGRVEVVDFPAGFDGGALSGVVGGLSGMADSSWRSWPE